MVTPLVFIWQRVEVCRRVVAIFARRRSCLLLPKNNSILISTILHLSMSEPMSYLVTWLLKRLLGRNRFS